MNEIRLLRADEIDVRVLSISEKGFSVLLYKDARVDMAMLDEVYGVGNWQRHHEVVNGNLFCNVGVRFERDNSFGEWVWKQDVGVESFTEKQKGEASDSFKRACFNWGIGRELYTAPSFMWINPMDDVLKNDKGKYYTYTKLKVSEIGYNDLREINQLVIVDDKNRERYSMGVKSNSTPTEKPAPKQNEKDNKHNEMLTELYELVKVKKYEKGIKSYIKTTYNKESSTDLNDKEIKELIGLLNAMG